MLAAQYLTRVKYFIFLSRNCIGYVKFAAHIVNVFVQQDWNIRSVYSSGLATARKVFVQLGP